MFFARIYAGLMVIVLSTLSSCGQESRTQAKDYTTEFLLQTPHDTTQRFALCVLPKGEIRGFIVLLPGYSEMPQETILETDIPAAAAKKGFLTVILALRDRTTLYIDSSSQQALEQSLGVVVEKYHLQGKPFVLGGFSLGGSGAVLYAERAMRSPSMLRPAALFTIDPPLDFERFSLNAVKALQRLHLDKNKDVAKNEYLSIISAFESVFGGNIYSNAGFRKATPYIRSDTTLTNIRSLARLPLRFYCEPDYRYWRERDADYDFQSNELDCASMIADLRGLGNDHAALILSEGKGFRRAQQRRHPHSWSIVDAHELVQWLEKLSPKNK